MGQRTQSRIGTTEGVKTVRVFSANPKTPDGFNTFIFRRSVERTLSKLSWLPTIDGRDNPLPDGVDLGDRSIRYSQDDKRKLVAFVKERAFQQRCTVVNDDFGSFDIGRTFVNEIQCHAISTAREVVAVSSAREIATKMVHFVGAPNEERGKSPYKFFEYGLAKINLADGLYLVMGEVGVRVGSRPYYDQRIVAKFKADTEVTFLHEPSRIGVSAFDEVYDNRFRLILQGVEDCFSERVVIRDSRRSPVLCAAESCTGCAACHDACAKGAILMIPDKEGFVHPRIDTTKCVRCGKCEPICPVLHPHGAMEPLAVYAVKAEDDELRLQSSSGGIFSLLARQVIRKGGIVFGAGWDKSVWRVVHKSAENEQELDELRGSKYVQSDTCGIYAKVKSQLATGRPVMFSGTPCQIAALRSFLGREYDNLGLVDVICHAAPSPLVWRKYLGTRIRSANMTGSADGRAIRRISFRRKDCGWKRYSLSLDFADGREYQQTLDKDPFLQAFLNEFCNRPSCQTCPFKSGASGADLTLGDYWGIAKAHRGMDDDKGMSIALVNTQKGKELFKGILRDISSIPSKCKYLRRLNPALVNPIVLTKRQKTQRVEFFARLDKENFDSLVARLTQLPLWRRGLSFVRRCAVWAPNRIVERIVYR